MESFFFDIIKPKNGSGSELEDLINKSTGAYIIYIDGNIKINFHRFALLRLEQLALDSDADLLYCDYILNDKKIICADTHIGSVRDDFDMGCAIIIKRKSAINIIKEFNIKNLSYTAFYFLRLKLSLCRKNLHVREFLYNAQSEISESFEEHNFAYTDKKNRNYQLEAEKVFTEHLKDINAYLPVRPKSVDNFDESVKKFDYTASIVIPVKNRERTIADAVNSALNQITDFKYNVLVVENFSTDKTAEILSEIQEKNSENLFIIQPETKDTGIGGCWNTAVTDHRCGAFVVQLDSDDLYFNNNTLQIIVDTFKKEKCAMITGSYKLTDFNLNDLPVGIIDHKEYTIENGHNNALRINGFGAPRCFFTPVLRNSLLPDTSYGEDYATALKITREYQNIRIFDVLYICRRWEGNSDAQPDNATILRNNEYKDFIRKSEIIARQKLNKQL